MFPNNPGYPVSDSFIVAEFNDISENGNYIAWNFELFQGGSPEFGFT
ncbi:hypothetical protein Z946_1097 [Sulfitobacter noctilucicola]|nr:hypothetical protein Z946_1097 [Sulfitobacter noctilucicola]